MDICFAIPDDILHGMLDPVPLPFMARVEYALPAGPPVEDLAAAMHRQVQSADAASLIQPGQHIAVAVGSRGIDRLPQVVAALVAELRALGAEPFIVPAMGSHGGATARGQTDALAHLGVTQDNVGAPIRSHMETVEIGRTPAGAPVLIDRLAMHADGIVLVARIKPHTAFHGPYESGMAKMIAIGLGKQAGAAATHARGFGEMAGTVPAMAQMALARAPIRFAVALIENAHDRIVELRVVRADQIMEEEPALLERARAAMARLPFERFDVLVIDQIGKNISGDGADPNITGRFPTPYASGPPDVTRQAVLDLADASGGNANGIGTADFTTLRAARKIDLGHSYPNALTSTVPGPVKIPMILPSDRLAIAAAILTCNAVDREPEVVRIANTLRLDEFWVSGALLDQVQADSRLQILEDPAPMAFDDGGELRDLTSGSGPPVAPAAHGDHW